MNEQNTKNEEHICPSCGHTGLEKICEQCGMLMSLECSSCERALADCVCEKTEEETNNQDV